MLARNSLSCAKSLIFSIISPQKDNSSQRFTKNNYTGNINGSAGVIKAAPPRQIFSISPFTTMDLMHFYEATAYNNLFISLLVFAVSRGSVWLFVCLGKI